MFNHLVGSDKKARSDMMQTFLDGVGAILKQGIIKIGKQQTTHYLNKVKKEDDGRDGTCQNTVIWSLL